MFGKIVFDNDITQLNQNNYQVTTDHTPTGQERTVYVSVSGTFEGSFNIPPTKTGVIIYREHTDEIRYIVELLKFGLVPIWESPSDPAPVKRGSTNGPPYSKEIQASQAKRFNFRKESLAENKSSWLQPRNSTRCVVPIQGYFEWQKSGKNKTPYYVHLKIAPLVFLAGLYSHNTNYNDSGYLDKDQPYLLTFAIGTGPGTGKGSNDLLWLHSRKPIAIEPNSKAWHLWLDPAQKWDPSLLEKCLDTDHNPAYDSLVSYQVAAEIGNPGFDSEDTIKEKKVVQKGIALFFSPKKEPKSEPKSEPKQEIKAEPNLKREHDEEKAEKRIKTE